MYKAKLPKTNDNISHESPLKDFFTLSVSLIVLLVVFLWVLGFVVDYSVRFITPETEIKMFSKFGDMVFEEDKEDKNSMSEFQPMLDGLSKCAEISHPLKLHFIKSDTPNAFAYPGGHIVVNTAIFKTVKSQNGLAFVLSHELGHFKDKDHLRSLGRNLISLAVVSLVGVNNSKILDTLSPVSSFMEASYSQKQESQADEQGLKILNCYYHHVGGASEFFEYMQKHYENSPFESHYFSTHPETKKRINDLKALMHQKHFIIDKTTPFNKKYY